MSRMHFRVAMRGANRPCMRRSTSWSTLCRGSISV